VPITIISVTIAVLGTVMLVFLFVRIQQFEKEHQLKKHRSHKDGMSDLLNYAAVVDDGVIVCKNGALMAAWTYETDDASSTSDVEKELISSRINSALSGLGNGWVMHVDAARHEAAHYPTSDKSFFPDPVSNAVDEERRRFFGGHGNILEGVFVITLTWFPPILAQRKFVEMMFDDDSESLDQQGRTQQLIKSFKDNINSIESNLSLAFKLNRLKSRQNEQCGQTVVYDDFLQWLHYCITGLYHPIQLPQNSMYLDSVIGHQELWGGVIPKVGQKFVQVISIGGFPLSSHPGVLNVLTTLPIEYRWSSRYIFMDQHEGIAHLNKFRKKWKQKIRGFFDQVFNTNTGSVDHDAKSMVQEAEFAIAELNAGTSALGYYTSTIVLMHEDRVKLEGYAHNVKKEINRTGFVARLETLNTMEAYLGSLPGHADENVRRPLINTINLADMLPSSSIWTGEHKAPCPLYPENSPPIAYAVTQGSTAMAINTHVNDLGHLLVIGPTGAGKSTLLVFMLMQMLRYKDITIYAFDKGLSMYATCKAVGGQHYALESDDNQLCFCPLQHLDTSSDFSWAKEWIETILILNDVKVTSAHRNLITDALTSLRDSNSHTLSDFMNTVQDNEIRDALHQYTVDGAMGHLLDADEDGLALGHFTVFELEEFMSREDKYVLPVLLYLFQRIERNLKGQPAVIALDEAWLMFAHPVFRNKIDQWLRGLRKANCIVVMATQNMVSAIESGIIPVLNESVKTKIFLANPSAQQDEQTLDLYLRLGLTHAQIGHLVQAVEKRDYFYTSPLGRRMFDLKLGSLALAFAGATSKSDAEKVKMLEEHFGDHWLDEWLKYKRINQRVIKNICGEKHEYS